MKMQDFFKIGSIFIILLLVNIVEVKAQGSIGTERPTTSTSSYTISKNTFQFEQGFVFWNDTTTMDGIFRVAVSKRAEVRLFTSYDSNSTYLGAKVNLFEQNDYKPGISIQGSFGNQFDLVNFRASWSQKITEKLGSTFNVGKGEIYYVIAALGYSIGDKASIFIEGVYDDKVQQFNAGGTFLLNSETQIDLSVAVLTTDQYFVALGISRRFLYKDQSNK